MSGQWKMRAVGVGATVVFGAAGLMSAGAWSASAQSSDRAWYQVVNQGRSAGTSNGWQPVNQGFSGTIPFMDDFEIQIRPTGTSVTAMVQDGRSQVATTIDCANPRAPHRAGLVATRTGDDQPTVAIRLQCSATRPDDR